MSTSRPRTPVTDRLSQLVSSRPSSRPSSPTTGTDTSTLPVSDPPSAQAVLDPLMQQLRRSTSHRTTSALAKSSSTGMQAKSTATRALTSPAAAVVRNANTPAPHTVDAESLPAALSAALSDEDVYAPQRQLIDCVPRQRPINLVQQQQSMHKQGATVRHPQSFLSLPSLTGSPYLDGLARISLPTYRGPTFGGSPLVKDEPAPTSPTNAIASLRQIASRSNSVSSVREIHTTAAQATSPTSPAWWWFQNKGDVDKLLDESDQAETVENEGEQIRKKYATTTCPVVFCHGLLGFDKVTLGPLPLQISHWRGIQEVLSANGVETLLTRVPGTSSPADRAKVLAAKIEEVYPGRAVHLIGHSMGGLDCRYLASQLLSGEEGGYTFTVKSVTTIGTPHRGSAFADHFIEKVGVERIPSMISWLDMLPIGGGDGSAFRSLTPESMRQFNTLVLDAPGVQYFSWGAVAEPGYLDAFKYSHSVILEKEGPNDGLVSIESAKWGVYLGTLQDVNHLDLIGWLAPFKSIAFKPGTFYLGICDYLARTVEGQLVGDDEQPKLEHPEAQAAAGVTTEHRSSGDQAAVDSLNTGGGTGQYRDVSTEDLAEDIAEASGVTLLSPTKTPPQQSESNVTSLSDIADQAVRQTKTDDATQKRPDRTVE